MTTALILASASPARRRLLEAAGLAFEVVPADVDEEAHRQVLEDHDHYGGPTRIAETLARVKAEAVSRRFPDALVIGADQVLALDRQSFAKAPDIAGARATLAQLAGRTHQLHSAVTLAERGSEVWAGFDSASLTMRRLDAAAIEAYLAKAGERILGSVGCYELEGLGVNLFERIEGDFFTILGLPLLPLLAELRRRGAIDWVNRS